MDLPTNWISRTGRDLAGAAVVFDLDGVISDASHRQHYLVGARSADKDWDGFFGACVDDPPIAAGVALVDAISADITVVILTARVFEVRDQTIDWLSRHKVRHDWLILRGEHEGEPSTDWKRRQFEQLADAGAEVGFVLDDDPRNVAMARTAGYAAMYVPSGYYTERDEGLPEFR